MKPRTMMVLNLMLVVTFVMGACTAPAVDAPAADVPALEEPVAPVEEVVVEPVEEPAPVEEPVVMTEAELDLAYQNFLAGMVAYNTIGLDGLNELLVESPPFLLDVRSAEEVEKSGYIEGSVLIPLRELGSDLTMLPPFDEPIVSYCGSGWRCTIAMTALGAMGWEDVRGLKSGSFGGWVEAGYPLVEGLPPGAVPLNMAQPDPAMAAHFEQTLSSIPEGWGVITAETLNTDLIENPELILIDVRRTEELDEKGRIEAANFTHIPLEEFINQKSAWPTDKDAPVVIYCGSGHRSTMAMTILWSYGYTDVRSLKGGISGWVEAGFPVAGGAVSLDEAYSVFLADMEAYNTVTLDAFNTLLVEEPTTFILDVRQPDELEQNGYIEGAVNLPLREVAQNIDLLPSFDTTIVSYCGSGWRCTIAMTLLEGLGWENVLSLKGGSFGGWVEAGYPVATGQPPEPTVFDVAAPDAALLQVIDETFQAIPDGYGVITAENLNLELLENPELFVIDVRRLEELEEKGVLSAPNLVHIPLEDFIAEMDLWPADLDAPIVVYCGSGHRSTMAMAMLWSYGYTDVHSLKGGFSGWVEAGYPVAEMAPAP